MTATLGARAGSCRRRRRRPARSVDHAAREAVPADIPECGRILYEAFATLAAKHGFPPDFPTVAVATGCMQGPRHQSRLLRDRRRTGRPDRRQQLPRRAVDDPCHRAGQRRSGRAGREGRPRADAGDDGAGRRAPRPRRPAAPDQLPQPVPEPLREARVRRPRDLRRDVRRAAAAGAPRLRRPRRRPPTTRRPATPCASGSTATTARARWATRSAGARRGSSSASAGSPATPPGSATSTTRSPRRTTTCEALIGAATHLDRAGDRRPARERRALPLVPRPAACACSSS